MITAWRLDKKKYAKEAFTGEGARQVSGRWHHQGIPVVYVSETISLAILEKFVHLGYDVSHIDFVYFKIEIPDSVRVEAVEIASLPSDWGAEPPANSTKDMGSDWATKARSAVLKVPSVLAPESWNYILNPSHPDFRRIVVPSPVPYKFDERMWKT